MQLHHWRQTTTRDRSRPPHDASIFATPALGRRHRHRHRSSLSLIVIVVDAFSFAFWSPYFRCALPSELRYSGGRSSGTRRNKLEGHLLLCAQVPAPALARSGVPVEEVELSFGVEDGKLYAVSLFSRTRTDGTAIASATTWLERALGAPDVRIGSSSGKATFTQEYHFANYTSQITATPLGERIAVREHYALVGGLSR